MAANLIQILNFKVKIFKIIFTKNLNYFQKKYYANNGGHLDNQAILTYDKVIVRIAKKSH